MKIAGLVLRLLSYAAALSFAGLGLSCAATPNARRARDQPPATPPSLLSSKSLPVSALGGDREADVRARTAAVEQKLIAWRRDIHQHPELGEQETRTAKLVADHLRALGLEVREKVAVTGVVGVLRGARPGKTVALRAHMDALPVKEPEGLPFASKAKGRFHGSSVDVMHACGHDAHTAMLMAAAEVLAGMRDTLAGTVVFVFQPAEEGSSLVMPGQGRTWGAKRMLDEGLFEEHEPDAVFAIHVMPGRSGELSWRSGATTASGDTLDIVVTGRQGHGGMPWNAIDPIVTSALTIAGLQTVVSRRANIARSPAVVTIGSIHGGTGPNIVPESVQMTGTIRAYDATERKRINDDVKQTATHIAESAGATAKVDIVPVYDATVNDGDLAKNLAPVLTRAAEGKVSEAALSGASEDFSFLAQRAPGLYVFLGVTPSDQDPAKAAPNHSPSFFVDERALVVGTRALVSMALGVLDAPPQHRARSDGSRRR